MTKFEWTTRAQLHIAKVTNDWESDWSYYAECLYDNIDAWDDCDMTPEEIVEDDISYWD